MCERTNMRPRTYVLYEHAINQEVYEQKVDDTAGNGYKYKSLNHTSGRILCALAGQIEVKYNMEQHGADNTRKEIETIKLH